MDAPPGIVELTGKGKRSQAWKHFGFLTSNGKVDKSKTMCKLCFKVMPYSGNTSNMNSHLSKFHWHAIHSSTSQSSDSASASTSDAPTPKSTKPTTITQLFNKQQPMARDSSKALAISKAIAEFVILDLKPFSTVDGTGFKNLLHVAEPRYTVLSRNHMVDKFIIPMYHATVEEVKSKISKAVRHAYTTDGWQSIRTESYNTTTVHFIDPDTFELHSIVLDTKMTTETHTAENLANEMKLTVQKWDLKEPACVTDNAANITKACDLTGFPHLGCFAHTLKIAVNRCLHVPEVSKVVGKCGKIVGAFKISSKRNNELKDAEARLGIKELQLLKDVETRWNSTLAMMMRLLQVLPAVYAVLHSNKELRYLSLSDDDLKNMEDLVELLVPLKRPL